MKEGKEKLKAQVSIFIILGVMLFAAGLISYFVVKQSSESIIDKDLVLQGDVKVKAISILNAVKDCEALSADASIIRIGLQGGYSKAPENYLDFGWMFIPYYFIEGKTYLPDKIKIEKELASSFDSSFQRCLNSIETGDLHLMVKPSKTTTEISKGIVRFKINMPFVIGNLGKETTYNLKDEPFTRNSKLFEMYELASYMTEYHKQNPAVLCVDCLLLMTEQRGLFVDFANLGETTKIVIITEDLNETKGSSDFIFQFVERYKPEEKTIAPGVFENV